MAKLFHAKICGNKKEKLMKQRKTTNRGGNGEKKENTRARWGNSLKVKWNKTKLWTDLLWEFVGRSKKKLWGGGSHSSAVVRPTETCRGLPYCRHFKYIPLDGHVELWQIDSDFYDVWPGLLVHVSQIDLKAIRSLDEMISISPKRRHLKRWESDEGMSEKGDGSGEGDSD